ncbi:hypothetical protein ACHAXA_000579 [Cyclostephanos tholiformis]|uniref:ChrR-like cupin domain-containing protein n=1 Tax=Cyclostephanos tholiformis TaxID=382380 RepID=A0ABD3SSV3_9STRA
MNASTTTAAPTRGSRLLPPPPLPSILQLLLLLVVFVVGTTMTASDALLFQRTVSSPRTSRHPPPSPPPRSRRPSDSILSPHSRFSSSYSRRDHRALHAWTPSSSASSASSASSSTSTSASTSASTSRLRAAPEGALSDIVVHSVFDFLSDGIETEEDTRVWVPQSDRLSFRPLCLCTSQGYYVNLLKFTGGGGVLGRHRHSSPVHALTLRGTWGYEEHDWRASPGTYVYEPPGETHTLIVDDGCDEMITLFHVTGSLLYVSGGGGEGREGEDDVIIGYDDVFTKLDKARRWYEECGLGRDFADRLIR